jgi:putative endonuclease
MGSTTQQKQALGAYGEALAARFLVERGMVLLDHNWRCPDGEIDLILRDDRTLVICEVKTRRTSLFGEPLEAITIPKMNRLKRLGAQWLQTNGVKVHEMRFDIVGIVAPKFGVPVIEHIPGVG